MSLSLSLSLWLSIARATAQDVVEDDDVACETAAPSPADSWGPDWVLDGHGTIQPELVVYALGAAEHWVAVTVFLGSGMVTWTEGPFYGAEDGTFLFDLTVPAEVDARLAEVVVLVTAEAGERRVGSRGARAYLWSDGTNVSLIDEAGAEEATASARAALEVADGVEAQLVGREVTR